MVILVVLMTVIFGLPLWSISSALEQIVKILKANKEQDNL